MVKGSAVHLEPNLGSLKNHAEPLLGCLEPQTTYDLFVNPLLGVH